MCKAKAVRIRFRRRCGWSVDLKGLKRQSVMAGQVGEKKAGRQSD